jgi:hypothetical protein
MTDRRVSLPELPDLYRLALEDAIAYVTGRYEPIGILATGTIVRGNPSPASDLDLFVIWNEPKRQRVQRFFRGIPAEIFVNPPHQIEQYFSNDSREGRPVTAHMFATGIAVHDPNGVVASLQTVARTNLDRGPQLTDESLTRLRYGVAGNVEDANDIAVDDPDASLVLLHRAVDGALSYRFLAGGSWIPRTKELFVRLAQIDPDLADLARHFYRATHFDDQLLLARQIVQRSASATGTFEWESALEDVAP